MDRLTMHKSVIQFSSFEGLPGFKCAKGSSPDSNSHIQREKLNTSALMLYFVHWVKISGAIHRKFFKENKFTLQYMVPT